MRKLGLLSGLVIIVFLTSFTTFAVGADSSGGGKGVVCRNPDGSVKSVELLDLWESRVLYHRQVNSLGPNLNDKLTTAFNALKESVVMSNSTDPQGKVTSGDQLLFQTLQEYAAQFGGFTNPASNVSVLSGVSLTLTDDSYELAKPEDCTIEQLVIYRDALSSDEVLVNKDLVDKMDDDNRAALIVHESFYSALRNTISEQNSIRTRRAVGWVFAGQVFNSWQSQLPSGFYHCSGSYAPSGNVGGQTEFYIFETTMNGQKQTMSLPMSELGQAAVGFFPAQIQRQSAAFSFASFLNMDCTGKPYLTNASFVLGGAGPVDFDDNSALVTACGQPGSSSLPSILMFYQGNTNWQDAIAYGGSAVGISCKAETK